MGIGDGNEGSGNARLRTERLRFFFDRGGTVTTPPIFMNKLSN